VPDGQELLGADPGVRPRQELFEAVDAGDAALAQGALEEDRHVVAALGAALKAAPAHGPGPLAEEVDVAGVVHLIDEVRAAGAAADLAEDHLAVGLEVPLHVGEARAHVQRLEHAHAQLNALLRAWAA
jgi:hypothetical protein